jgi:hypothetical protein
MNSLFQRLGLKDEKKILVLNIPEELKNVFYQAHKEGIIIDDERMPSTIYTFALVFVMSIDEIGVTASMTVKSMVTEDPRFWIAYPKSTSHKYKTDIKSEVDWEVMDSMGFGIDERIDIDENWAAYKFSLLPKG